MLLCSDQKSNSISSNDPMKKNRNRPFEYITKSR